MFEKQKSVGYWQYLHAHFVHRIHGFLRSNLAKPNESITKGVHEKFIKINFVPKAFGDVGRATLKSNNITARFVGERRFGMGLTPPFSLSNE